MYIINVYLFLNSRSTCIYKKIQKGELKVRPGCPNECIHSELAGRAYAFITLVRTPTQMALVDA